VYGVLEGFSLNATLRDAARHRTVSHNRADMWTHPQSVRKCPHMYGSM